MTFSLLEWIEYHFVTLYTTLYNIIIIYVIYTIYNVLNLKLFLTIFYLDIYTINKKNHFWLINLKAINIVFENKQIAYYNTTLQSISRYW